MLRSTQILYNIGEKTHVNLNHLMEVIYFQCADDFYMESFILVCFTSRVASFQRMDAK